LLGGPKRGVRSCQSLVLVVQSRLIDTQQHIFLSRRHGDRGAPTTLIDCDGGHEDMPNHRFKPIQLGARTVSRHSLREGNYLTERLLSCWSLLPLYKPLPVPPSALPTKTRCAQETCFPSHDETTLSLRDFSLLPSPHSGVVSVPRCRLVCPRLPGFDSNKGPKGRVIGRKGNSRTHRVDVCTCF
jgi:hypothetical protein